MAYYVFNYSKDNSMNKNIINRIGKRYGFLTVISLEEVRDKNNKILWKCKCDCGNEVSYNSSDLNQRLSCGKCNTQKGKEKKFNDLTGKKFGNLTVIKRKAGKFPPVWECKCICGNIKYIDSRALLRKNNSTTHCGCLKNKLKKETMIGKVFGELTVIERDKNYVSPNGISQITYKCLCKCGKERTFSQSSLKRGLATHCGCKLHHSLIEEEVELFLKNNNISYIKEYRDKNCFDKRTLPFDFAFINENETLKFLVELNGQQHYEIRFGYTKERFEIQKKHDKIKSDFCLKNNIKLVTIPFWEFSMFKEIILKELE